MDIIDHGSKLDVATWQCQSMSVWFRVNWLKVSIYRDTESIGFAKISKKYCLLLPQVQNQFEHLKQFPFQEISKCPTIHSLKHPWAWNAQNSNRPQQQLQKRATSCEPLRAAIHLKPMKMRILCIPKMEPGFWWQAYASTNKLERYASYKFRNTYR